MDGKRVSPFFSRLHTARNCIDERAQNDLFQSTSSARIGAGTRSSGSEFNRSRKVNIYQQILSRYWGYSDFRPIQEDIIKSVANGHDTLGLMPTGGGKSITFQVPGLAKEGICLVITPLIALMKDQVEKLRKLEIKALAIYSGMTRDEIDIALENCIYGNYKFLYLSPERLGS